MVTGMLPGVLTDRYELPLSTASSAARDAYVEGCEAKLTMYPGAIERFDRAIAADPSFALAHAARAHLLLERGDAAAARASMMAAKSLAARAVDGAVRRREETVVGPAPQQLAAVDDKGIGDGGRSDPVAALRADRQPWHLVGGEQG